MSRPPSLTERVRVGGVWGLAGTLTQAALALVASVVVARYLVPEDFAVAAIGAAVMNLTGRLANVGLADALVRQREDVEALAATVFLAVAALGLVLAGALALAAPLLARFYHEPRLTGVLLVLAVALYCGLLGSVPRALLQRELRLREISVVDTVQRALAALFGVALAVAGTRHWALVLPTAAAVALCTPVLFRLARFRPSGEFALRRLRECLSFTTGVFLARGLSYLGDDLDSFVLGRSLPRPEFGTYAFAFGRAYTPYQILGPGLQAPLLAAFSHVRDDAARLKGALVRVAAVHFFVLAPLAVGLALLADPLIPVLFGEHWRSAVPVFRVFALWLLLPAAGGFSGALLLAQGRAWLQVRLNLIRLLAVGLALAWCVATRQPVLAVALAVLVANLIAVLPAWLVVLRGLGVRLPELVAMYGRTLACLVATAVVLGAAVAAGARPSLLGERSYLVLAAAIVGGAYGLASLALNRTTLRELFPARAR